MKKEISFTDAENHRARLNIEITKRNGYPEFTASGTYMGCAGQCLDMIKPSGENQAELIRLWEQHHLKDVSKMHNFAEHLEGVIAKIEYEEREKAANAEKKEGDEAILEQMHEEGIDDDMLDACKAYIEVMGDSQGLKDFEESYCGEFRSDEEFAMSMADDIGAIDDKATWPNNCIDWEQAACELMQDYSEQDGYYFRD